MVVSHRELNWKWTSEPVPNSQKTGVSGLLLLRLVTLEVLNRSFGLTKDTITLKRSASVSGVWQIRFAHFQLSSPLETTVWRWSKAVKVSSAKCSLHWCWFILGGSCFRGLKLCFHRLQRSMSYNHTSNGPMITLKGALCNFLGAYKHTGLLIQEIRANVSFRRSLKP